MTNTPGDQDFDERHTTPSAATVDADRHDAAAPHVADREPTPAEEEAAEAQELDPHVAESYRSAIDRGAHTKGEGRI